jgi:hypothetical protein
MKNITAFDSKDFKRSNRENKSFFSSLGCGVTISNPEKFQKCYVEKLTHSFKISMFHPYAVALPLQNFFLQQVTLKPLK